jgi:ATP-dependent DNA helicase RecQ
MNSQEFLKSCAAIDLEVRRDGEVYQIGATWNEIAFERHIHSNLDQALAELDEFIKPAQFLLGHNLIQHDVPILRGYAPQLHLFNKPLIDTLVLSPLAFPENPYHHLIKDYKLSRESKNEPVADAQKAIQVFTDEWDSLAKMPNELLSFFRFCFEDGTGRPDLAASYQGIVEVFSALGAENSELSRARDHWLQCIPQNIYCRSVDFLPEEILSDSSQRHALAFAAAWIRIAGGNSVVPGWVRHQFPQVPEILRRLREVPCTDSQCHYCIEHHNPQAALKRYFDFPSFRSKPSTDEGESLQECIVRAGMAGDSLLAILPTGGGKSLCYQLPGLIRHFRRGLLTIVISPLQALMKDQVDNLLERTGSQSAAALYGLLTLPERGEVLERVRLGDIALLYVSPEQLRNRSFRQVIGQREIGCWVFDEAHCISKWGHDFRPDYLYATRFIREFAEQQKVTVPPITCFTATAKPDVKQEILEYFKSDLGQSLRLFESSMERENLQFEVQLVSSGEKLGNVQTILETRLPDKGVAIVYTATRAYAEQVSEYLQKSNWDAEAFHAGLEVRQKRQIQQQFIAGSIQVICATNAFGLGIDKEDVRLVIHADMPGTLENYMQEAGRAGRDLQDACCILLYDEEDAERQFGLGAYSKLTRRDIAQILRGLRRAKRNERQEAIITPGDLLRDEDLTISFDGQERGADTKVKTAIAWLERSDFVQRNENRTRVFQGSPQVKNMEKARVKIKRLNLPHTTQKIYESILEVLFNAEPDEGLNVDQLAELPALKEAQQVKYNEKSPGEQVLRFLHAMSEAGLIKKGLLMTAFVRHQVKNHSQIRFEHACALELAMLKAMQEAAPDAPEDSQEHWQRLSLRHINQHLKEQGFDSNPEQLSKLLKSQSLDSRRLANQQRSMDIKHVGQHHYNIRLHQGWQRLEKIISTRQALAKLVLDAILEKIPSDAPASAELLIEFSSDEIAEKLRSDMFLGSQIKDPIAAIARGLMFLDEQKVIILQQGLGIFRQAMTVQVNQQSRGRRYTKGDFEPLAMHYSEQVFQVHVMNEYAHLGTASLRQALQLVLDYFTLDKQAFVRRYFSDREKMLARATTQASFHKIVEELNNPIQTAVVAAPENQNMLVLAGPGSGKTKLIVHRCAYLVRVLRISARRILILCFNRNAAITLRHRLRDLLGQQAAGVLVMTYHALAMRITGTSFQSGMGHIEEEPIDFDAVISDAVRLLKGDKEVEGFEADELRDKLLGGYQFILVDEYQDIDQRQYDLISALAGRVDKDPDRKLTITAVGDDDQNIYTFRGTNTQFIRRFQEDYTAQMHYMVENYRSTRNIINTANQLIRNNRDRMKTEHSIAINRMRRRDHIGGEWGTLDPVSEGRVQIIEVHNAIHQSYALAEEIKRLKSLHHGIDWSQCAVLTRTHEVLHTARTACEYHKIPISWPLDRNQVPRLNRVREIYTWLEELKNRRGEWIPTSTLQKQINNLNQQSDNPWWAVIQHILDMWIHESGEAELPIGQLVEFAFDVLAEQRREQRLGKGMYLGTVHSAKGMEFDHVFILDGGWIAGREQEEERRLYYVGMTRARKTLCCFKRDDQLNPHVRLLSCDDVLLRGAASYDGTMVSELMQRRYTSLGMKDLYIDYPGLFSQGARIHQYIANIRAGDVLTARADDRHILLIDRTGHPVARLSNSASLNWMNRLEQIQEVRVLAMLRRLKSDSKNQDRCRCEEWELPLVEVIYKA